MSGKSMDVFSLRESIVSEYRKFARSFTRIHAEDIRAQVEAIYSEGRFWPDTLGPPSPRRRRAGATEAERRVVQRVGQSLFRDGLLDLWEGKCAVTDLAVPELLRASHIKPWTDGETNAERLDGA